jgi:NADH dehydrogenase
MTLIVGATGMLGLEICRQLRGAGRPVRVLVRSTSDPAKRAELARLGAELVEGDLKDPASIRRACADVRAVVSTASSTLSRQAGDSIQSVDEQGQLTLVDAAKQAGVEHFVFVSFRDNPQIRFPLTEAKRAIERRLKDSGMAYTILQASYFMEVWLSPALGFDYASGKVTIYGDGDNKVSWVSYRDVARFAAAVLEEPKARNRVFDIGGPQALSPREVVRTFEVAGAPPIAAENVPESQLRVQLDGADDPLQKSFAGLMLQYARGDAMDMSRTLGLLPVQLTSVRDYAIAALSAVMKSA